MTSGDGADVEHRLRGVLLDLSARVVEFVERGGGHREQADVTKLRMPCSEFFFPRLDVGDTATLASGRPEAFALLLVTIRLE